MNPNWRQWQVGYYNFCKPSDLCWKAFLCPVCFQAGTLEMAFGDSQCASCFFLSIKGVLGCAINRRRIREKYHIHGTFFGDFWDSLTFCCSLVQERKEIILRGYPGQDRSAVYESKKLTAKVGTSQNSNT